MKKIFKYLFISILTLFSLGQLQRIQLNEAVVFYIHDLLIVIWLILLIKKRKEKMLFLIRKYFFNYLTYIAISWIVIGLIINFISHNFTIIPLLYIARTISYLLFALSLPITISLPAKSYRCYWFLVGLFIAVSGIVQYLLLPDTRFLWYSGWDDHYFRLIGTQFDPNFTGIILTTTFFMAQSLWNKQSWIKISASILLTSTILLTYSRASFLSFIIGLLLIIFIGYIKSHQKNIFLSIIMGLFILLVPFLPRPDGEGVKLERTASISARIESNRFSLDNLKKHELFFGKGLFTYSNENKTETYWPTTAHFPSNLIVFLFTSTGIIGLGLALVILYKTGQYLYHKDTYIFISFIAILIHSQFNHTLFQPFIWLWLTTQIFTIETTRIET